MIGYLGHFSRVCTGPSKNHIGTIKGSNCKPTNILKGSHQDLDTITVTQNLGHSFIVCRISFFQINTTTNNPLSSFGRPVQHSFIHTDDITDLCCTSLPALKVCLLHTDSVLLSTEHPLPKCIFSSVLHIVCKGCALLNALIGCQIKQVALKRR